jgi:uncharacterized protein
MVDQLPSECEAPPLDARYVGDTTVIGGIVITSADGHPALAGSRCPVCGDRRYPARELCPNDAHVMDRVALASEGTIYEVVRVELAPYGFQPPYYLAYVDLNDGVRVFARVDSVDDGAPAHGDQVALTFSIVRAGTPPTYGPVYRRVLGEA